MVLPVEIFATDRYAIRQTIKGLQELCQKECEKHKIDKPSDQAAIARLTDFMVKHIAYNPLTYFKFNGITKLHIPYGICITLKMLFFFRCQRF